MDSFFKKVDLFNRIVELESSLIEAGINPEKIKVDEIPKIEMDEAEVGMVLETFKSAGEFEALKSIVRKSRTSPMKILEEYVQGYGLELFFGCLYIANTDYFILRVSKHVQFSTSPDPRITANWSNNMEDVPEDTIVGEPYVAEKEGEKILKAGYYVKINDLSQLFSFSDKKQKYEWEHSYFYADNAAENLLMALFMRYHKPKKTLWEPKILQEHKKDTIFCRDIEQKIESKDDLASEHISASISKMVRYNYVDPKGGEVKWENLYNLREYERREITLYNYAISKEYWDEIIKVRKRRYKRKIEDFKDIVEFQLVLDDVNEEIEIENLMRRYQKLLEIKKEIIQTKLKG